VLFSTRTSGAAHMQTGSRSIRGKVELALVEGAPHIRLVGECDLETAPAVQEHLSALLESGEARIVFDLQRVTFLDSSILSIFLIAYRETAPAGGEVVLLCRPGFICRLLMLLELNRLVTVCTPEEWRQQVAAVH
jgi:anti-sigma B factor antagonist